MTLTSVLLLAVFAAVFIGCTRWLFHEQRARTPGTSAGVQLVLSTLVSAFAALLVVWLVWLVVAALTVVAGA